VNLDLSCQIVSAELKLYFLQVVNSPKLL